MDIWYGHHEEGEESSCVGRPKRKEDVRGGADGAEGQVLSQQQEGRH